MSVVSGKVIFCEGKQTSLDFRLLNRVVENLLIDKPTIVPSGSKFTFSVFTQGYFSRDRPINQRYIIFRDRDFDAKPTAHIGLIQSNSMFLTYRACVENYLLNAELIHHPHFLYSKINRGRFFLSHFVVLPRPVVLVLLTIQLVLHTLLVLP
ncbi:hypothetical protein NUACC26_041970 [Scytonema sp. NUACC26]